ncbi:MAG: GNAT family N-acetyltransferase [Gammaproteobacteria bacterium]|nr:GNAT family N-acetyltransferase [Gammaproteobacteria bacterium]MBV8308355.1 GNAT family N-acetyltransferase [Gammaproteobacteria bacterium]
MKIRDLALADYAQWLPLWNGYNAFYGRSGPTALPEEVTQMTWKRFFDASEPMYALVAELEGTLIGLTHYLFHRSTTLLGPICYLQDLYTTAERRRTGVGRGLIEAVYRRAHEGGSARVYWQTHETNLTAQRLYEQVAERSGFIVYRKNLP